MAVLNTKVFVPMGLLLAMVAVVLPIANVYKVPEVPIPGSCDANDEACQAMMGNDEDDTPALSLLQRAASVVSKASTKKSSALEQNSDSSDKASESAKAKKTPVTDGTAMFYDVKTLDYPQLILTTAIYGYVLYVGSNMIGDGSELLCFFQSVAGIVGSVVVPILGAVPDSAMVLFSGLNGDPQVQISTGVGALAGSTVMLLTFPWFVVNMAGSVPLKADGTADYSKNHEPSYMFTSGVTFGPSVAANTKIMVVTSLTFLVIQIPAFFIDKAGVSIPDQAKAESTAALAGLIISIIFFFAYIYIMYSAGDEDTQLKVIKENIKNRQINLAAALHQLKQKNDAVEKLLPKILQGFFFTYDNDKSNSLDSKEFELCLKDLGLRLTADQAKAKFDEADGSKDGKMSFEEFCKWVKDYDISKTNAKLTSSQLTMPPYGDDDEEEEEILPDDLMHEPLEVQQRWMFIRSMTLMIGGTLVVLLFADPAVDVFTEWGNRFGINSFYVGFLLAPFASNASELLVALGYAQKKTGAKITMSFESLVGAACMNNTLCLATFFALIYFRNLAWMFKAETAAILIIQWLMAGIIFSSNTQRKIMGFVILSLYPFCLFIVWFLENICGWD